MSADTTPRHPIRVVARRTGLTPATIRAWERRYQAVEPIRSEGGQRLYSDTDLARLETLRRLTEMGRSISSVASLDPEEAVALLVEDRAAAVAAGQPLTHTDRLQNWTDEAYALTLAMDDDGLEGVLWRAFTTLGAPRFLESVAGSLLHRIGEGWAAGDLSPAQEHLASDVVDRVLAEIVDRAIVAPDGPRLVVGTLPDERHGLGARLVCAAAALEGWTVKYLGPDLPPDEIASAARKLEADAVAISVVTTELVPAATRGLTRLRDLLPARVHLLVGGNAAGLLEPARLPAGVKVLTALDALRTLSSSARLTRV